MTRKDYELLAAAIRRATSKSGSDTAYNAGVEQVRNEIARSLGAENAGFNYNRFVAACGQSGTGEGGAS